MTTTKAVSVKFRGYGTVDLPAGLRCSKISTGGTAGLYWLDEFPPELFPRNSMILHDAVHYGLTLNLDQVEGA